jgi:hypothetical protein
MPSLINLESQRDRLVEEIMELAESTSAEEIAGATESNGADELIVKFNELEAAIADKVDAIAATIAAQKGDIAYLKSRRDEFTRALAKPLPWSIGSSTQTVPTFRFAVMPTSSSKSYPKSPPAILDVLRPKCLGNWISRSTNSKTHATAQLTSTTNQF